MKVLVKTPRDFVVILNDEDFAGLSEKDKKERISLVIKKAVAEHVSWIDVKERIAFK